MLRIFLLALSLAAISRAADTQTPAEPPRAARSVHLGWIAPEAEAFHIEMRIDQSTRGSYFMAAGWNTGYFGVQELGNGRKVAIFSVWDPAKGDDPTAVPVEQRVELLHQGDQVRIRRFGGEGTGGQAMTDFNWELHQPLRFVVAGQPDGSKTAYSGFIQDPTSQCWLHLVTFRTRTGGSPLKGLYSFIEDFRRDTRSVQDTRRASWNQAWIKTTQGTWTPLNSARFTASGATWESKDNIDAGTVNDRLYLATGGPITTSHPLRTLLSLPTPPGAQPPGNLPQFPTTPGSPIQPKPVTLKAN